MTEQTTQAESAPARQRWVARAGAFALVVVVLAPMAASWRGLVSVGHDRLGLPGWSALLVPLTLDAAALYVATLALRAVLRGDSGRGDRGLVWVYAGVSAALNIWHGSLTGGVPAAAFYGLASASAVVLYERTLRHANRDRLHARGEVDAPMPRFRASRWLLWLPETWTAMRTAVGVGVASPQEALMLARLVRTSREAARSSGGSRRERRRASAALVRTVLDAYGVVGPELAWQVYAAYGKDGQDAADATLRLAMTDASRPALPPTSSTLTLVSAGKTSSTARRRPRPRSNSGEPVVADALAPELDGLTKRQGLELAWRALGIEHPNVEDVQPARAWLAERGMKTDKSTAYKTVHRIADDRRNGTERESA